MHLTFSFPSPSHLSHGLRCFETAPAGGRQTPFLPVGSPCCPACGQGPKPTARETKGRFSLSFINLHFFYCAVPGLFSITPCKKQEIADGTVIFGGTGKVVACLGVLDQYPGSLCLFGEFGLESGINLE